MNKDTPQSIRQQIRNGDLTTPTSGYAPGFVQCNLVILPKTYAQDFAKFCQLNPRSCPLIAMSERPGDFSLKTLGENIDIRSDIPLYRIYKQGQLVGESNDITHIWQDDFVAFLLGCSFSFEEALIAEGIEIRNITEGKNVPMYKTNIQSKSVNGFAGNMVVSMRPMLAEDAQKSVTICQQFPQVHGAPIHIGAPQELGVLDINQPDFGDAVTIKDNEVPVFWACGVTPQVAIENAQPDICITHSPGHMLITDIPNSQLRNSEEV
ncbi:putative hydro-lyase [Paraglaciecola aquimarina]|uniref:Putative hydro-lyase L0668_06725 n=1 Tax=Paraglaciecola algarum TaxID=3050085 RepID=A0ABS9D5T4_9ALTE|nr:putative hydro-lyase [Paraglaciecola sp. G1-23]MCF2947792.1 putative hydro-lyase [Paraglaciecola sp. G1-23]